MRKRLEDLPLLVNQFIEEAAKSMDKVRPLIPEQLYDLFGVYQFAGNIRELRALVFDAVAAHQTGLTLSLDRFKRAIKEQQTQYQTDISPSTKESNNHLILIPGKFPSLSQAETCLIHEAMSRANENQGVAAALLGISRPALNRRIARLYEKEGLTGGVTK